MAPVLYMQDFSPPVRSVLLTAEALGLKLEKKVVDLSKKEHLTDTFLKLNPQHTVPTLDDNGTVVWDSHAINEYLVDKYGKDDSLYPKDLAKRAVVNQRLHFDSGVIFSWLRYIARSYKYKGRKELTEDQIEHLEESYSLLESFLKGHQWVAGDSVTIADFSLVTNITSLTLLYPVNPKKYPNIINWIKRAEGLPYYKVHLEGLQSFKKMFQEMLK
ncbi:hypothetical protein Zmor_008104 [Zophobas morio]|uniref:Uncharacterized protein n=1 Tax=Zophobas morio TaxID=2755281 RepID=A0AA38J3N4_9CUCU|nr:hypothetical protein Zmor_008104 [Zophobas morio]